MQDKFKHLETVATGLLHKVKVGMSPDYSQLGMMTNRWFAMYLSTDGEKSLFECGWRFTWNRGKRRIGCCCYRTKTIQLSRIYVENTADPALFYNTILHEIAHALTPNHNHDATWKRACVTVGADPSRLCNDERIVGANKHLAGWQAKCCECEFVHVRHRKPKYMYNLSCAATDKCRTIKPALKWVQK